MALPVKRSTFFSHKEKFFNDHHHSSYTRADVDNLKIDYKLIHDNIELIEQEFKGLFFILKKQDNNCSDEGLWLFCYHCSTLLERYYRAYRAEKKALEQQENQKSILAYYQKHTSALDPTVIASPPVDGQLSKIIAKLPVVREWTSFANFWRIHWVFNRLMLKNSFPLLHDIQLFNALGSIFKKLPDLKEGLSFFDHKYLINSVNVMSVAFFATLFFANLTEMLIHVIKPTEEEKNYEWHERLSRELKLRGLDLFDHATWAIVNLLTNFNKSFNIPAPVANGIVAAVLLVDIIVILLSRHRAWNNYIQKLADYQNELDNLDYSPASELRRRVLNDQIAQLKKDWDITNAKLLYLLVTTAVFMSAFVFSMLAFAPAVIAASYYVCVLGVSMYLSTGAYVNYTQAKLEYEAGVGLNNEMTLHKDYIEKRNAYLFSLLKHSVMPTLFLATWAISWPAGLVLTALYLSYLAYNHYQNKTQASLPAASIPALEEDDEWESDSTSTSDSEYDSDDPRAPLLTPC